MIQVSHVTKKFRSKIVLDDVSIFTVTLLDPGLYMLASESEKPVSGVAVIVT